VAVGGKPLLAKRLREFKRFRRQLRCFIVFPVEAVELELDSGKPVSAHLHDQPVFSVGAAGVGRSRAEEQGPGVDEWAVYHRMDEGADKAKLHVHLKDRGLRRVVALNSTSSTSCTSASAASPTPSGCLRP